MELSIVLDCRTWQRKQDKAFTSWLNLMLASKYKARKKLESDKEAMDCHAFARCRIALGQLRKTDVAVTSALTRVWLFFNACDVAALCGSWKQPAPVHLS